MKNITLLLVGMFFFSLGMNAQTETIDDLMKMKADKQAAIDALSSEIGDIDTKIGALPGWKTGGVGVLGFNLNSNSNWYAAPFQNSQSRGGGITASAFANKTEAGYFWNNLISANLNRSLTILDSERSETEAGNEVDNTIDNLEISSLAGKKLNDKWALSAEGRYASQILNFNRPGKLTISTGATWTPIDNLVVIIHPLGYEKNWPGDFASNLGAKIGATYAANILPGVAWTTNLSAFLPYGGGGSTLNQHPIKQTGLDRNALTQEFDLGGDAINPTEIDYSQGDLTNWVWNNTFSTNIFKGIGVGLNVGLRKDKQIANQAQYERLNDISDFESTVTNPLQVFYSLGLSYTL